MPGSFIDTVATLCSGFPEVIITNFAEVVNLYTFRILPHLPDYFVYRFHSNMVSLLPPFVKGSLSF